MSGKKRKNIHPYLSDSLMNRFKKYCSTTGSTESSVVEEALQRFFDDRYDTALLLRRLDRQGRSVTRLARDLDFFAQAFSIFVQIWFAYTPKIPEDAKGPANQLAQKRFADYIDYVARSMASGDKFFDLIPRDEIADETELSEMASQGQGE
jgi:hypothetical protein